MRCRHSDIPDGPRYRGEDRRGANYNGHFGMMAGLVRLPVKGQDILIYSNADTDCHNRIRGTVWASFDGGETWPVKRLVEEGGFALVTYYAVSYDGVNWQRPVLGQLGENNMIDLFDFHSPSIIRDEWDPYPSRRHKAIGSSKGGFDEKVINELKGKFKSFDWYNGSSAYWAAYSADGLNWNRYPKPALLSSDTITLSQDTETGEYMAFHKIGNDPRVTGRQVFLSVSKDMENWSEPEPVMVTDEIDHQQARLLERVTHSEFYNMSAFPYGNQWLGVVTHFRRTGEPLVRKGPFSKRGRRTN